MKDEAMYPARGRAVLGMLILSFGLGIGAIIALLFAPSSGKITRHQLGNNIEEKLLAGRETVKPLVKRAEKRFDEIKETVEDHRA